jgi:uncharacterized membrane protein YfcA
MVTATAAVGLFISVLATAFLSGIFGMAGGIILMGVCIWLFTVSQAMVLQGIIQVASNGSRVIMYFHHIVWRIFPGYLLGCLLSLGLFTWIAYVPERGVVFLMLGLLPFLGVVMRGKYALDVMKPGMPVVCGFIVACVMLTAGVSGPILDSFFLKSAVSRYQVVATKAVTMTISHIFKLIYFGFLATIAGPVASDLPWWLFAIAIPLAFAGTALAKKILEYISDLQFFRWSTWVVASIGLFFLGRAAHEFFFV